MLETHLVASRGAYLLGEKSIADIAIMPFVRQFAFVDKAWFDQCEYPEVVAWLHGLLEEALFASVMTKYPQWRPGAEPVFSPSEFEHR